MVLKLRFSDLKTSWDVCHLSKSGFSIWIISHTDYSKLALGLLIVVLVVLFPKGIVGALASWRGARVASTGGERA